MEVDSNGFESQISSSEDERAGDCEADDEQSDWVGYSINDPDFFVSLFSLVKTFF